MNIHFASLCLLLLPLIFVPSQKSQWTTQQHQEVAFAQAIEALPELWDRGHPLNEDMEVVIRSWLAVAEKHTKIFKLSKPKPVADVVEQWADMLEKTLATAQEAKEHFGLNEYKGEALLRLFEYSQKKCSYSYAVMFAIEGNLDVEEMVRTNRTESRYVTYSICCVFLLQQEKSKGPRLIVGENGVKKVRFSDGTIEDINAMPLPVLKLRVQMEMDKTNAEMDKRGRLVKESEQASLFMRELKNMQYLFDYVMELKYDDAWMP